MSQTKQLTKNEENSFLRNVADKTSNGNNNNKNGKVLVKTVTHKTTKSKVWKRICHTKNS